MSSPTCASSNSVRVYQASHVQGQLISFVWLEVPRTIGPGRFPGRLFVASAAPVVAIVPTMIDLPCELSAGVGAIDLLPAPVEMVSSADGHLQTNYSWGGCSRCSQCYMSWTFSLDLQGQITNDSLVADLVLNETFHAEPMKIVSLRMPEVTQSCTQPHIVCRAGSKCDPIVFAPRP